MKDCIKTCTLFYVMFITYLFIFGYTLIYSDDLKKLRSVLDKKQKIIHDKIRKERLHHFYMGLGSGSVLGLLVLLTNTGFNSKYCMAGIILILTMSTVYYVLPKSDYMINHLNTEEQRSAWMTVSRNFMKKKIIGFILAVVLYFCLPMII